MVMSRSGAAQETEQTCQRPELLAEPRLGYSKLFPKAVLDGPVLGGFRWTHLEEPRLSGSAEALLERSGNWVIFQWLFCADQG
jgi:hypothetical protein